MADNKKHHFVPKFFLRYFSLDVAGKLLGVYMPGTNFYKIDCGLEAQAQSTYLYGNDGEMESTLCTVEGMAATILGNIHKTSIIPRKKTVEYTWLLMYTVDQMYRTRAYAKEFSDSIHESAMHIAQFDEKMSKLDWENMRYETKYPAAVALGHSTERFVTLSDLKYKLLINKTDTSFIISDDPVAKYNQYFEAKGYQGYHTSMLVRGLQLFFPISPTMMLMFYDDWAYDVGKNCDVVHITSKYDMEKLNALQIIGCDKAVYFNGTISQEYLQSIKDKYGLLRDVPTSQPQYDTIISNNRVLMGITQVGGNRLLNLNLSFVRMTKKALKSKVEGIIPQIRKKELRAQPLKKIKTPQEVVQRMLEIHPPIFLD